MKKNILIIALFGLLPFFMSCEEEINSPELPQFVESQGTGVTTTFALSTVFSDTLLALDFLKPETEVHIEWDAFAPEGSSGATTYRWVAIAADATDFGTPLLALESDEGGTATTLTTTHGALNEALKKLGISSGETAFLKWNVASNANGATVLSDKANTIAIKRPDEGVLVTFQLEGGAAIPDGHIPYLAGAWADLGVGSDNWQQPGTNSDLKMTFNSDEGVWQKTFFIANDKNGAIVAYKYFLVPEGGNTWDIGEEAFSDTACQGLFEGAEGTSNRKFKFDIGDLMAQTHSATVVTWQGVCSTESKDKVRFVVTVPDTTPDDEDIYMTGNIGVLNWKQPGAAAGMRLRPVDGMPGTFDVFLPMDKDQTIDYKFFLATTEAPRWNGGEQVFNATNDGCIGRENRSFTYNGIDNEVMVNVVSWEGICPF